MDLILSQDVDHLGKVGDMVKVKDGYARNLLLPRKLAFTATETNVRRIQAQKKLQQEVYNQSLGQAQELAEKLAKISPTVNVEVNDLEKLYGAVSEAEIIKAIEVEGFQINKKDMLIEKSIEELGIFEIGVKLHPEVIAKIRLWVTKK